MSPQNNNFDFLRVFAATLVLVSHQYALSGGDAKATAPSLDLGGIGLMIFFSISGYLVAQSWERDPNPWRFTAKRFLRIWPGLIAVTLISALVLGPLVTNRTLSDYFFSVDTLNFFLQLKLNIKNELPGVFVHNPFPKTVNGSLWTIPIEVHWYFMLFLTGILGILRRRYLMAACAVAFYVYYFAKFGGHTGGSENWKLTLGLYFVAGMILHHFGDIWKPRPNSILIYVLAMALICDWLGYTMLAKVALIPCFVVLSGSASTPILRRFGRFGDVSYGIYIYAFPVQQTIIWLTENKLDFGEGLVLTASVTLLLAFLSWHLVESPAMKLKLRLRKIPFVPQVRQLQ